MEALMIVFVILGLVVVLIAGNVLIYKWIVGKAVRKNIRPYFATLGYEVQNVKFAGLLSTGDFKRSGFPLRPFMHSGYPMQTIYVYLYLSKDSGLPVRITAKIVTLFLAIRKIEYSSLPDTL